MREMVSYLSKYIYFKRVYINQKYFNVLNYVTQIHIQVLNQYQDTHFLNPTKNKGKHTKIQNIDLENLTTPNFTTSN